MRRPKTGAHDSRGLLAGKRRRLIQFLDSPPCTKFLAWKKRHDEEEL